MAIQTYTYGLGGLGEPITEPLIISDKLNITYIHVPAGTTPFMGESESGDFIVEVNAKNRDTAKLVAGQISDEFNARSAEAARGHHPLTAHSITNEDGSIRLSISDSCAYDTKPSGALLRSIAQAQGGAFVAKEEKRALTAGEISRS